MSMKKMIAYTLILCMMLGLGSYFPGPSFALSESIYTTYKASIESKYTEAERQVFKTRIDNLSEYKGRNENQDGTLYRSEITIEQILYYLIEYKGVKKVSPVGNLQMINPYVYMKYKVVAYDELSVIEKDQAGHGSYERVDTVDGTEVEYRYLGFTDAYTKITNDFYPADFTNGTDPLTRIYNTTSEATGSWNEFLNERPHYGQLYQLLNTNLKNDDTTDGSYRPVGYTTFDLLGLNSFPGISGYLGNNNLRSAFGKVIKMQEPSLGVSGQFKLVHGTNKSYYDTFRTEEMTLHADVTIYPSESVYFIAESQDQVTIEYEVRTIIDNDKTNLPYSNGLNISEVKINSEGNEAEVFSNPSYSDKSLERVLSSTFTKTVNVNHLDLSEGQDTVTIDASSSYKDMTGYTVNFSASPVQVKVNAESEFLADFTIHNLEGDNVTDAHISVPSFAFTQPENVTLTDASATNKGNIISRTWYVLKNGSYDPISTSNETGLVFTVNADNRADVLNSNRLSFKLEVQTDLSLEKEVAIHEVTFRKTVAPQPVPSGPVAIIAAKLNQNRNGHYRTMEGEVFDIHGRESYHPEGVKLEKYVFNTNGGYTSSTGSKKNDYIYYLESGKYYPKMTVTDANGGIDNDSTTIIVIPAEFTPIITIEGTLKENRKVSISVDNEHGLRYYPIDESSLNWTITPLDGQGNAVEIDGGADGHQSFDLLFNKKGKYQVSVTGDIYNGIKHRSGIATQIITIAEDLPPVVDFSVSGKLVRNVSNGNLTEIIVFDKSYSPDGDIISQRKVWWCYNDDNDGDFGDIDWTLASAGNAITTSMFTRDVGQYEIKEEVREQFGQTTIAKFIVDADYKRSNSDNKADDEKRVEIINIAPTVTLKVANKKAVNVVVYHDYDAAALNDFKNRTEILKAELLGKQMELSTNYLKPTQTVGNRTVWTTYFDTYVNVKVHAIGDDEDRDEIDWVQDIRFLLDSYTSEGNLNDVIDKDSNRFELVDVRWGSTGYGKYKYKGRKKDYTEYRWKELIVSYKENGVLKEKTHNYVYDYEKLDLEGNSNRHDAFTYDSYEIEGTGLVVDQAGVERLSFAQMDNTFYYNAPERARLNLPSETSRVVTLKKYLDTDLENILNECKDEDTFFINLTSKEENRIALDKNLLKKLEDNNISYLTLDDYKLIVNPLEGSFRDSYEGDRVGRDWEGRWNYFKYYLKRPIVTIGNLAYEIDEENNRFMFMGSAERFENEYGGNFENEYLTQWYSLWTNGYTYRDRYGRTRTATGMTALQEWCYDQDEIDSGVESMWDAFRDYAQEQGYLNSSLAYRFPREAIPESWYRQFLRLQGVEKDGSIVGYKLKYDYYNKEFEYEPKIIASSGYVGMLNNIVPITNEGNGIRGYIHSNGNIYFKDMTNFSGDYSVYDYLTITEGTSNIEMMRMTEDKKVIYVYTKDTVVKYDFKIRKRTVLTSNFIERRGTSVKIGENKWLVGDKVYDGYKEIYTNDVEGYDIKTSYVSDNRAHSVDAKHEMKYYIDLEGNLYEDRKYHAKTSWKTYQFDTHTLIDTDVKSIPFMQYISEMPTPEYVSGTWQDAFYYTAYRGMNHCDEAYNFYSHYVKDDGFIYSREGVKRYTSPMKSFAHIGGMTRRNSYGRYLATWGLLVSLEDGSFGFSEKFGTIKPIKYANLTVGSASDVVGDSKLIAASPLSNTYASLDELIDSIYNAYENYASSNSVYVLLGDSIESTSTYEDYEGDEAYNPVFDFVHTDPSYFENSLGRDPNAGTGLLKPLTKLNYVGQYTVNPKVKDNPKDDDRFDNYRLTNKDETTVNVYVHRKPVARMKYKIGESTTEGYFALTCSDGGSYDLDHLSTPSKGISAWKFGIKSQDEASWTVINSDKFTHNRIVPGLEYKTFYMVKDIEGVWSDPVYEDLIIEDIPIHLEAKLKAHDEKFNIAAMPITEFFNIYDIETEYTSELRLEIGLYDGDVRKGNLVSIPFSEGVSADTDSTNSSLITWNERTLQVPSTLTDKNYKLRVTAIDVARPNKKKIVEFDVGVRTPINPVPDIPQVFTADETVELICKTSKYTDELSVTLFDNTAKAEEHSMIYSEMDGDYKVWKLTYKIPEGIDDGSYGAEFTGKVNTIPIKTQSVTRNYEYITLKILSAVMYPEDPMAGDKLIWIIESVGGVDRYELIFEDDVIDNDQRKEMGYDEVEYPYYIEVDETQSRKTDQLEYILWCTTPQSITLKNERNRPEYAFKIRAWKDSSYVDVGFTKEISGDVRELLKVGQ